MVTYYYLALIHKELKSDYGISFPDFPGLVSACKSIKKIMKTAEEALAFHAQSMIDDGEELPLPGNYTAEEFSALFTLLVPFNKKV